MVLQITMSEDEKALLQKQADAVSKTLDEFARERLLGDLCRVSGKSIPTLHGNGLASGVPEDAIEKIRRYAYDEEPVNDCD